jgi:predicted dehydrogenase
MGRTHASAYLAARAAGLPVTLVAATAGGDTALPGDPQILLDAPSLLARTDIHAVSICTHTDSHVELALAALAAGKHVLLEKPVALSSAKVATLAAAARDSGLVCMPAMCMRFWPGWPWLRDRVRAGSFGALLSAEFTRLSARPSWGVEFYRDRKRSGGALFDLHIHDVDFIWWCFGEPSWIQSAGGSEDVRTAYHFPAGSAQVTARGAWLEDPPAPFAMRYVIRFEAAEARFDLADSAPLRVQRGSACEAIALPPANAYEGEVRHFVELALGRAGQPVATLEDAWAVTTILEAEERSLATAGAVAPHFLLR